MNTSLEAVNRGRAHGKCKYEKLSSVQEEARHACACTETRYRVTFMPRPKSFNDQPKWLLFVPVHMLQNGHFGPVAASRAYPFLCPTSPTHEVATSLIHLSLCLRETRPNVGCCESISRLCADV